MEWEASTLHTTSKHGVSSITTTDALTSAASSQLNWHTPADLNGLAALPKDEIRFLRVCHHISNAVYHSLHTQFVYKILIYAPDKFQAHE